MTPEAAAAVLNVDRGADRRAIEAAYRRHARMVHPDRPTGNADEFVRVGRARDVLLAALDSRHATPLVVPATAPVAIVPTAATARTANGQSGRGTIIASAALLLVVLILVIAMGTLTDVTGPNPGAIRGNADTIPQDSLSGAVILPVTSVSGIETHCDGNNACWVWRIVAKKSCTGSVDVAFYAHANSDTPVESVTEKITVRAGIPTYVSVPATEFTEPAARITQYDCT